jgi:MFS family permease
VTVTASLMLFVFGLTQSTSYGWSSGRVIGSLVASALLMVAFLVIESRSQSPLVPLGFFKRRTLAGANLIGFGLGTTIFGMFFLLSLYMQIVLGFSALETGVGYLAVALTAVAASGAAQALVTRIGVKPVLATGLALIGVGLVLFTQLPVDGTYVANLLPGFILVGVGLGFSFVPVSIAALAGVAGREAGLASGLINTSQQIGGALGLAILTTVSTTKTDDLTPPGQQPSLTALVDGYSLAFWVAAGFAAISLVTTLLILKRQDLVGAAEEAHAPAG